MLLKLKVLKAKKDEYYQIHPLLKIKNKTKVIIDLNIILNILFNNLNVKLIQCCIGCRYGKQKNIIFDKEIIPLRIEQMISLFMCEHDKNICFSKYSRELELKINKYMLLFDAKKIENLVIEKYRLNSLKKFNYISLVLVVVFSTSSLIFSILSYLKN